MWIEPTEYVQRAAIAILVDVESCEQTNAENASIVFGNDRGSPSRGCVVAYESILLA